MTRRVQTPALAGMTPEARIAYARAQGVASRALADAGNTAVTEAACPYVGDLAAAWLDGFHE